MNESPLYPLAPSFAKISDVISKQEEFKPLKIRPKSTMQLRTVEPLCRRDQEIIDTMDIEANISNER